MMEQGLTDEHEGWNHDDYGDVHHPQTYFWLKDTFMLVDVSGSYPVVKEVSEYFSQENAADWGEIEESKGLVGETVTTIQLRGCEKNGCGYVDTDSPSKDEEAA
jgi:hypothetical protein